MEEDKFKKILYWNLGIYFCYTTIGIILVKSSTAKQPVDAVAFEIWSVCFMGIHLLLITMKFILLFSKREKELGKSYLLSFLLIILIGLPTCVFYF